MVSKTILAMPMLYSDAREQFARFSLHACMQLCCVRKAGHAKSFWKKCPKHGCATAVGGLFDQRASGASGAAAQHLYRTRNFELRERR